MPYIFCNDTNEQMPQHAMLPQDASAVMKHLEGQLERYAQAATFLGRQLPFRQLIQMTGVTHVVTHGEASQETVMLHSPAWETSIATPIAWGQVSNAL